MDSIPIILFLIVFIMILFGYPVALTLGGISVLAGLIFFDADFFYLVSLRIYGIMNNFVLLAVPLFIFMGLTLEKSGIAEKLLETMAILFGKIKGGLAYSVIIVGGMLAASTGIVGATVVTMGLISLPTMLRRGYDPKLATGVIASSGTLGQIIPPSVVLVLLGSVLNISVGNLFTSALLPGMTLVFLYLIYVAILSVINPSMAPAMPKEVVEEFRRKKNTLDIINAFFLPFILIFAVLGSIFMGIASPTEAAGIGALGALTLSYIQGSINLKKLKDISAETTKLTSIVFMILLGATSFSLVFRGLEGDKILVDLITSSNLSPEVFLIYVLITVFITGFFIDFIEIIFIVVPVIAPILIALNIDLIWVGIMLAINLQTSFLTPPFGFSLFYLKSVSPKEIKTTDIYKGVVPFVIIQVLFLVFLFFNPEYIYIIPDFLENYNS
ncbi:MAG: TRAP transporter large permease subunit [Cytophagales bacterium]